MGDREPGATFLHFDEIDWAGAGAAVKSAPKELVEAARKTGARQKRMATGENGFYMNHNVMPAGFTVPPHVHDHDELIVVLEGGCTVLDGGPTMEANDAVVIKANHAYGFTCGPEGMRFLTIRTGEAGFATAPG
jgi:quercetin dioxygenase-like cupin family protein